MLDCVAQSLSYSPVEGWSRLEMTSSNSANSALDDSLIFLIFSSSWALLRQTTRCPDGRVSEALYPRLSKARRSPRPMNSVPVTTCW